MSASGIAARGPLSSVFAQWLVLGIGGLGLLGNDDVSKSVLKGIHFALSLPDSTTKFGSQQSQTTQQPQPIIIHSGTSASSVTTNAKIVSTLIQIGVAAIACWGSYAVLGSCLPDFAKEYLPVTRKFFDQAVSSLGKGIIQVRDTVMEQIGLVKEKQDELANKQDATHSEVLSLHGDINAMQGDLNDVHDTLSRCESSLMDADKKHSYTARGIRLLVRCVGAILPGNTSLATELDHFSASGDELLATNNDSSNSNNGSSGEQQSEQRIITPRRYNNPQQYTPQKYTPMSQQKRIQQKQYDDHDDDVDFEIDATTTNGMMTPNNNSNNEVYRQCSSASLSRNGKSMDGSRSGRYTTTPLKRMNTGPENETPPQQTSLDEVRALLDLIRSNNSSTVQ